MMFNREKLAWAAGFFDGEGHVSKPPYKSILISISQLHPEVLERFRDSVGCGLISRNGKGIYVYRTNGFERVQQVACCLWPFLGPIKRTQFLKALEIERSMPVSHMRQVPEGWTRNKETCYRGHPIDDPKNVWISPTTGKRQCRTCNTITARERRKRDKNP